MWGRIFDKVWWPRRLSMVIIGLMVILGGNAGAFADSTWTDFWNGQAVAQNFHYYESDGAGFIFVPLPVTAAGCWKEHWDNSGHSWAGLQQLDLCGEVENYQEYENIGLEPTPTWTQVKYDNNGTLVWSVAAPADNGWVLGNPSNAYVQGTVYPYFYFTSEPTGQGEVTVGMPDSVEGSEQYYWQSWNG